jgi:porphobilinogen synthase
LAAAVVLSQKEFIQPLFLDESIAVRTPINSLNGINSDTLESLLSQIAADIQKGITKFLLFPVPAVKAENNFNLGFVTNALEKIKKTFGHSIWIAADCCLCAYTSHGHCGILNEDCNKVLNDTSVKVLADCALQMAQAGADCIAPSDMMDGRIAAIRQLLDQHQLDHIAIMSYSAKFSSQFYGPFRDACKSVPGVNCKLKDRKTYQISSFNPGDAIEAAFRDLEEGADIIMVKPAIPYLDIIATLKQHVNHPIAAYHVSGEYQGIELLAQQGIVDREKAHLEVWTSIKRAGAGIIISYAARNAKAWIEKIVY